MLFYQLSESTVGNTRFNLYAKGIYALEPEIRVSEITIITGVWEEFSRVIKLNAIGIVVRGKLILARRV